MSRFLAVALGLVPVTATARAEPVIAVAAGATLSAPFPAAGAELRVGYRFAPRWWWFAGGSYGPAAPLPGDTTSPRARALELRTGVTRIRGCGARGCTALSAELGVARFRIDYIDGLATPPEWLEETTFAMLDVRWRAELHLVERGRLGLEVSLGLRGLIVVGHHSEPARRFDGNKVGDAVPGAVIGLALIARP